MISNMEGSISHVIVFTFLIVLTSATQDQLFCCGEYFLAVNLSSRICENGENLSLSCNELSSVLYREDDTQFVTDGARNYFKVNESTSVQLSAFCLGRTIVNGTVDKEFSVIFCNDNSTAGNETLAPLLSNSMYIRHLFKFYQAIDSFIWKDRNETSTSAPVPEKKMSNRRLRLKFHQDIIDSVDYKNAKISMHTIACLISGALMAAAAALYIGVPQTDDLVEKCLFHVALNQSIFFFGCAAVSVVLTTGFVEPYLGNYCVVFWYLFVFVELSSFTWCAVTTYHLRKTFSTNSKLDGFKRMCQYAIVGYGIPALLIAICNIHVHVNSSYYEDILELSCNAQFDLMSSFYGFLPLIIISLINISFFVSLRGQLRKAPPSSLEFSVTSIERFKFRLWLNKKMFTFLVVPWLVIALLGLPMEMFRTLLVNQESLLVDYLGNIIYAIYFLLCSEGVIMFYVLTTCHSNI